MSAKLGQPYLVESGSATGSTHAVAGMRSQLGGQVGDRPARRLAEQAEGGRHRGHTDGGQHSSHDHPLSGQNTEQVGSRRTIDDMQLTHFGHSCLLASFPTETAR